MKFRKSFLIGIFLLGVLSLGFACADDGTSGEMAIENSQSDTDKLSTSLEDSNPQPAESAGDKEDVYIYFFGEDPIYPWTWSDSDGDSGPGIDIYFDDRDNTTGSTTIYLDGEVLYVHQGKFSHYLVDEETLWQHYNGNGRHTVKVVYSGDDRYNPATETCDFDLNAYCCDIEDDCLVFELSSDVSGFLTVKANGRIIFAQDIDATYARYGGYLYEIHMFPLEDVDSGANLIEVSFTSDRYSFDEFFEYYNPASNGTAPNPDDNADDASQFHKEARAGSDSKVSAGDAAAGNPLLALALALSAAVLLPRRK